MRHFLSLVRTRRRVGERVQCPQFEVEPRSRRQVQVVPYGTVGSTVPSLIVCLLLRAGPTPTDRGELGQEVTPRWTWLRDLAQDPGPALV